MMIERFRLIWTYNAEGREREFEQTIKFIHQERKKILHIYIPRNHFQQPKCGTLTPLCCCYSPSHGLNIKVDWAALSSNQSKSGTTQKS